MFSEMISSTCRRCVQAAREGDIETLRMETVRHHRQAMLWIGVTIAGFLLVCIGVFV